LAKFIVQEHRGAREWTNRSEHKTERAARRKRKKLERRWRSFKLKYRLVKQQVLK